MNHYSPAPTSQPTTGTAHTRDAATQAALERNIHRDEIFDRFQTEFAKVSDMDAGWTNESVSVRINWEDWVDVPVDWDELEANGQYAELAATAKAAEDAFIAAHPDVEVEPADHLWTEQREWLVYERGRLLAQEFAKLSPLELTFGPDAVWVTAESGEQVGMFIDWWSLATVNTPAS